MQHGVKLERYTFRGPLFIKKKEERQHLLQKNHKHGSIPNTSTIILIHIYQVLPKIQLIFVSLKWTQSFLKSHMNTSVLFTIPMMKITLLIHMKNTSEKIQNKTKCFMMWMRTQFLKNNWKTFSHILTITPYHQQWTQVSWLSSTMIYTTILTTQNIFPVSHLTPTLTKGRQHPNSSHPGKKFTTGWRIKLQIIHQYNYVQLNQTCKVKCKNSRWYQISWKSCWYCHHKNPKNKHHYTTLTIILYTTKSTKHNDSNFTQTFQPT